MNNSNVNNSNNSTITTTTSTNNSGDSTCNNTHNININILDARLNSFQQGLFLQEFNDLFASQRNMRMNDLHHQSLGMYQVHHHHQGQGHQSLGMGMHGHADPFFYHPTVSLPMILATAGTVSCFVSQLDLLYNSFPIWCAGSRNAKWLSSFKHALAIYHAGGSLCRGYNAELNHVSDWCVYQRNNKPHLEIEKQYLLGVIGI